MYVDCFVCGRYGVAVWCWAK